jgi:hypothetical protein
MNYTLFDIKHFTIYTYMYIRLHSYIPFFILRSLNTTIKIQSYKLQSNHSNTTKMICMVAS